MNNEKKRQTISARQTKDREAILTQLKKMPILQIACERAGVARSSYYRWRDSDEEFRKATDEAIAEGEAFITDMSESQLISLIRDKHFPAVQLWLRQHHPKYTNKVELLGRLTIEDEPLTPEQETLIAQALKLAGIGEENHEPEQSPKTDLA